MKVVTEQFIRDLLKEHPLKEFHVEQGSILSPAAKDYLNQARVLVIREDDRPDKDAAERGVRVKDTAERTVREKDAAPYSDARTGEGYDEKPESMTHLFGKKLVHKDHPRILFRGEMDHLQSQIVLTQALLQGRYTEALLRDLDDALGYSREILRAEVLDEPMRGVLLLGLSDGELREQSHHPQRHFGVKAMTLPHYSMGEAYARLNLLRSQARQAETAAVAAFRDGRGVSRIDIVTALNRLSSGFHILGCRLLSGQYENEGAPI